MHDTPRPTDENPVSNDRPLDSLIADLAAADPAAAPDIADEIAVRLEADLAAASNRALDVQATPEPS